MVLTYRRRYLPTVVGAGDSLKKSSNKQYRLGLTRHYRDKPFSRNPTENSILHQNVLHLPYYIDFLGINFKELRPNIIVALCVNIKCLIFRDL